jgi:hypothetical protein
MKARLELQERTSEGEPCPTPVVRLYVRDRYGSLARIRFRVELVAQAQELNMGS